MKPIRIIEPAQLELLDAAVFYNEQAAGLGKDFLAEIDATVKRIADFPEASQIIKYDIRQLLVRRFPYALLYRDDPEEIIILAVMHMKRHPHYWVDRLGE